nr:hypothetical protein CFP56_05444 [Quercus suber]
MLEVGMEWAEVKEEKKREKTHRTGFRVWGRAASECGWMSNLRRSVGWSCVSLSSVRGGGAEVMAHCSGELRYGSMAPLLRTYQN